MRSKLKITFLSFTSLLIMPAMAFAYLDPGTGSMIFQGLIAAVAIAGFTIRKFWYQILGFFGKKQTSDIEYDKANVEQPKD